MRYTLLFVLLTICLSACSGRDEYARDEAQATIASETGQPTPLPADVMYSTKPLINGKLYSKPNFEASSVAYFDTTQQIYILDTSDDMFAKARIRQDTAHYTGYVPKTILPEQD